MPVSGIEECIPAGSRGSGKRVLPIDLCGSVSLRFRSRLSYINAKLAQAAELESAIDEQILTRLRRHLMDDDELINAAVAAVAAEISGDMSIYTDTAGSASSDTDNEVCVPADNEVAGRRTRG